MRVLLGSDLKVLSPPFPGDDGETPTDCDSTPTCTVMDLAGDTLPAPTVTNIDDAGRYTVLLDATDHLSQLDTLTLTWEGETTSGLAKVLSQTVEVVDDHYATVPELRAILNDQSTVPLEALYSARDAFAELVETYRGTSWVGRARSEPFEACGGYRIQLDRMHPRAIRTLTVNGTEVSTTGVAVSTSGVVSLTAPMGCSSTSYPPPNGSIIYEYGLRGVPATLNRACREYVRATLLADTGGIPRNAISYSTGDYSYRMGTADWNAERPTGHMVVDDLLNQVDDYRVVQVA